METRVSSATREVVIAKGRPTVLIGERINPAGKKKMAESLAAGDIRIICTEAIAQVQAGADMLDVNVGAFEVDEVITLPKAVKAIMEVTDVPLCIDTHNVEALAAALKVYRGKPLINSVSGEERSLSAILPLAKEHKAAVIGILQDDEGIPKDIERRLAIARKIIERAESFGIPCQDVVIDCLSLAVGAEPSAGVTVIETIRRVSNELKVNTTVGASNISFGLPDRDLLNNAFVAMAIASGITSLIVDVARTRPTVLAADAITGRDKYLKRYINCFRQRQKQ